MNVPPDHPRIPFDSLIREIIVEWRKLPPEARNDHDTIEELLRDFHFSLDASEWDILEKRLNAALVQEGYTGKVLEALNETYRLITNCVREGFFRA